MKIPLNELSAHDLAALVEARGTPVVNLLISEQMPGMRIRIATRTGEKYILEIIDPRTKLAHVAWCRARPKGTCKYLAVFTIPSLLQVGDSLECANNAAYESIRDVKTVERLSLM
jgi:hypothetical protein